MFFPWYTLTMLALDSHQVIGLRLMKMADGGHGAMEEANLMVSEKIDAAVEAGLNLMTGGDVFSMIDRYREHVTENILRLS